MPTIRDKRKAIFSSPQQGRTWTSCRRDRLFYCTADRTQPERHDLNRQRESAEDADKLGFIRDHDHASRGRSDDFFAQQGATAALDSIEVESRSRRHHRQ